MSAHEDWQFLCRLFAAGTPVLRATLSPREVALLPHLGRAVQAAVTDQSCVLCPHCALHRAPVFGDGRGGRLCRCPDCGPVPVVTFHRIGASIFRHLGAIKTPVLNA